jgi:hypothetical protein
MYWIVVLRVVTPCNPARGYQRVGGIYSLHLHIGARYRDVFYPENGGNNFLRRFVNYLQGCMASQPSHRSAVKRDNSLIVAFDGRCYEGMNFNFKK